MKRQLENCVHFRLLSLKRNALHEKILNLRKLVMKFSEIELLGDCFSVLGEIYYTNMFARHTFVAQVVYF